MKIDTRRSYEYLYVLLLINNFGGELLIISNVYRFIKPFVLGISIAVLWETVVRKRYPAAGLMLFFSLLFLGGYTAYVTESKWVLYLVLLIVLAKDIDTGRLSFLTYRCLSVFLLFIVGGFAVQLIQFPHMLLKTVSYDHVTRYYMGFISPNESPRYWIYWVLLSEYLDKSGQMPSSILKRASIILGTVFFYVFTRSDALLLVPGVFFLRYMGRYKKWVRFLVLFGGWSFPLLWSASVFILALKGTGFFALLDNLCSGRLSLGIAAFRMYGATFFGRQPLEFYHWVNAGESDAFRLFVDNAYHMIMIQHGIIYLLILSFVFIRTSKKCSYGENICFIVYSIFALAENIVFSPTAVFPVIIAANACWREKKSRPHGAHKNIDEEGYYA